MRRILAWAVVLVLLGGVSAACAVVPVGHGGERHDQGKHKGWYKSGGQDKHK